MQAHEMMKTPVHKVKETETVRAVIEKFIHYRISGMPVVNDRNEVVAFISDGDILRYIGRHEDRIIDNFYCIVVLKGDEENLEEREKHLLQLNVLEIAKKKVVKVAWNADIEDIAAILGKKQIKKVPVERNGVLVGIISRGDVIRNTFNSLV